MVDNFFLCAGQFLDCDFCDKFILLWDRDEPIFCNASPGDLSGDGVGAEFARDAH